MRKQYWIRRSASTALTTALILVTVFSPLMMSKPAKAAGFLMQSGYYVGSGAAGKAISGLGFRPDLVVLKASTSGGAGVFKTSYMPNSDLAYFTGTNNNTASNLVINDDGFTLGSLGVVNTVNVLYTWIAFGGSDCSSSGNFCVGGYTGDNLERSVSTGFQPGLLWIKQSTSASAHFKTSYIADDTTQFIDTVAADTTGAFIKSFSSNGFSVGSSDNTYGVIYNFVAFKQDPAVFASGTYTGTGTAGTNITGLGFSPDWVVIKNTTSATDLMRACVMSSNQSHGNQSSYLGYAAANASGLITGFTADGFTLGSSANTNESGGTFYWFALRGDAGARPASGTFTMATGTYSGTGAAQSITSLSFRPNLVIIKDNGANYQVFRTSMIGGNATAYVAYTGADFTNGITALTPNGFDIGTSTIVNTSGNTYHWQAFGNAYNPDTNSGAADFAVGTFYGSGQDNRNITGLPFRPDLIVIKRNSNSAGVFKTSAHSGETSSYLSTTADATNMIQAINDNGFQVGTLSQANASGSLMRWFAFKESSSFDVGSYSGNGLDNKAVDFGFAPELVWIKRSTAVASVSRPSTLTGDNTQYFLNTANAAGRIKSFTSSGFTVGTQTEVNTSGGTYRYVAWKEPPGGVLSVDIVDGSGASVANPSYSMGSLGFLFSCTESTGVLGTASQKIRISNMSSGASWTTSIAATDGSTALWRNGGNTVQFDFNDSGGTPIGCIDSFDDDTVAGKLRIEPDAATITPQSGCNTSGLILGTATDFNEGSVESVTLVSASSSAGTSCYWDLTGVGLRQYVPEGQANDGYSINLTITSISL